MRAASAMYSPQKPYLENAATGTAANWDYDNQNDELSYRSVVPTDYDAVTSINGDVKSYASSKVEIELEFLAKRVEQERQKKRKLMVKAN